MQTPRRRDLACRVRSTLLAGGLAAMVAASPHSALAFGPGLHEQITNAGLGPPSGPSSLFTSRAVFVDIADQHDVMDAGWRQGSGSGGRDERHFDDCEFDGAAKFINGEYRSAQRALRDRRPFDATDGFGNALHAVQDFYAHSNWVEIGFPLLDDPGTPAVIEGGVRQLDLVDLSGAQSTLARSWYAPSGGGIVRKAAPLRAPFGAWDILLGADDWDRAGRFPVGWDIDPTGRPTDPGGVVLHVPTLIDTQGRTLGKLLVTGEGFADDECDVESRGDRTYNGLEHNGDERGLNKDGPTGPRAALHAPARSLATLQSRYEWCRMVYLAGRVRRDGLLLTTWIRSGQNPHPAETPCSTVAVPGPTRIEVTVESVRVLDSRESSDEGAAEVTVSAALYDSPSNFRRSAHGTSRGSIVPVREGRLVPAERLPEPLSICVSGSQGATFAINGWDNDADTDNPSEDGGFDHIGDDDDLLLGLQRRFDAHPPTGTQRVRTHDLEVRYRVTRSSGVVADPACASADVQLPPSQRRLSP